MSKVLILVEGQAEETFVRDVLAPYLLGKSVYVFAKLATTKRVKSGPDFKGGIVSYGKVKNDIVRLLHDTSAVMVTTMIDFYGLPEDFPGRKKMPRGSCYKRVAYLEHELQKDINHHKFLPYLTLHEFEAMAFVSPDRIANAFPGTNVIGKLRAIRSEFQSPEEIDEEEPPSERLSALLPEYEKPLHGPLAILEIGIDEIRGECAHFDEWLKKLEALEWPTT